MTTLLAKTGLLSKRGPLAKMRTLIPSYLALTLPFYMLTSNLASYAAAPPQSPEADQANQMVQTLRGRVQEFYELLRTRQFSKAEALATKDSRERLRDQSLSPYMGFRILSAQLNPDGLSAKVNVEFTVIAAYMGGPMPMERQTTWRLEDNEWRIFVPQPPTTAASTLEGMMASSPGAKPDKPEELKFKGHRFGLGVMKPGDVGTAAFPFTNISDHDVTITEIATDCDCIKVKPGKRLYKPGESGELVFDFDSSKFEYQYSQTMVVKTDPGEIKSYLQINAEVVPRSIAFPEKKPAEQQSGAAGK